MAESADINVDELRRRARRRLVGAVVLALGVAVVVPMLLETEQKPLGDDVSVRIPPIDDGKFVNRLSENRAKDGAGPAAPSAADAKAPPDSALPPTTSERSSKYDTRLPDTPSSPATAPAAGEGSAGSSSVSTPRTDTAVSKGDPAASKADAAASKADAAASKADAAASKADAGAPKADARMAKADTSAPRADARVAKADASAPRAARDTAAVPHDGFAVQLAAFADDKGANALAGRLKKAGYAAYTEPLQTSKGTLWRVRVGPYASRDAAIAARDRLKTEGQSGIVAALK